MLATNITLAHCQEFFGSTKAAFDLYQLIHKEDLDEVLDELTDIEGYYQTALYLPIEKRLRTVTSFDVFIISKEAVSLPSLIRLVAEPKKCLMYHHGFMYGTIEEYIEASCIPYEKWKTMPLRDFEFEFLQPAVANDNEGDEDE